MFYRMSRLKPAALVIFALLAAVTVDAAEPVDLVPADAVVVISGGSANALQDNLAAFLDAIQPGMSTGMRADANRTILTIVGDTTGTDLSGPFVLALMPASEPAESAEPAEVPAAEAAADDGQEIAMLKIAVFRLTDESAWRASMGDRLGKDGDDSCESFKNNRGDKVYVVPRDGCLMSTDSADLVAGLGDSSDKLPDSRKEAIASALSRASVCASVSVAAFRDANPDFIDKNLNIEKFSAMPGFNPAQVALFEIYIDMVKDVFNGMDELLVEFAPSVKGIKVALKGDAAPGTVFYDIFSEQKPVDFSTLAKLPPDAMMQGAMTISGDATADYMRAIAARLVEAAVDPAAAKGADDALANFVAMIDDAKKFSLFENVAFALYKGTPGSMYKVAARYATPQPADALKAWSGKLESYYNNPIAVKMAALSGMESMPPEISEETTAGANVKVIKQNIQFGNLDPVQAQVMRLMFGDGMVTRMAADADSLLLTMCADGDLMEKLLSSAGDTDTAKVQRSLESTTAKPSAAFFISVPRFMLFSMSMGMALQGAPQMQLPPAPETSGYATLATSFGPGGTRFELNVPTEEIMAAKSIMMNMMMMQMMQQQQQQGSPSGPAMPGGPSGPPMFPPAQ